MPRIAPFTDCVVTVLALVCWFPDTRGAQLVIVYCPVRLLLLLLQFPTCCWLLHTFSLVLSHCCTVPRLCCWLLLLYPAPWCGFLPCGWLLLVLFVPVGCCWAFVYIAFIIAVWLPLPAVDPVDSVLFPLTFGATVGTTPAVRCLLLLRLPVRVLCSVYFYPIGWRWWLFYCTLVIPGWLHYGYCTHCGVIVGCVLLLFPWWTPVPLPRACCIVPYPFYPALLHSCLLHCYVLLMLSGLV